jgi:hypothetical protein
MAEEVMGEGTVVAMEVAERGGAGRARWLGWAWGWL